MTDQLAREVANALWTPLVRKAWRGPRSTRKLSDYGFGQTFHPVCTATIPKAPSMNDTITQAEAGAISVQTDTHHVVLLQEHYRLALRAHSTHAREQWTDALDPLNDVPKPYTPDAREKNWDPFLTGHVYAVLLTLIHTATVWPLNHDTPLELIRDSDVRETVPA